MTGLNIAVLGDGGWGTTLAILLSKKGHKVTLWGVFPEYVSYLNKKRINTKFLPNIRIPEEINIIDNLNEAFAGAALVVFAVPSQHMRSVLKKIKRSDYPSDAYFLSVTKGIEISSLKRMSQVIREELGNVKTAVLSGPTIAQEVAKGIPTACVIASSAKPVRRALQHIFMTERFRIYTNDDVVGVELGGSLKNIIAIACGISDGLGFGTNTKAAILTRGLDEISRLGTAMGAKPETFCGLSGLGDLVTTCISPHSRNRFVGEQIGKGRSLQTIASHMQMIAEGIPTTKSAISLSLKYKVDVPITKAVYSVLYKNNSPLKAVKDLMTRKGREE